MMLFFSVLVKQALDLWKSCQLHFVATFFHFILIHTNIFVFLSKGYIKLKLIILISTPNTFPEWPRRWLAAIFKLFLSVWITLYLSKTGTWTYTQLFLALVNLSDSVICRFPFPNVSASKFIPKHIFQSDQWTKTIRTSFTDFFFTVVGPKEFCSDYFL